MKIRMIYPETRFVTPERIIGWAKDEIFNSNIIEYDPEKLTLEDAIKILEDAGACTFERTRHA